MSVYLNKYPYRVCNLSLYLLIIIFYVLPSSAYSSGQPDLIFVQIPARARPSESNVRNITSIRDRYVAQARIVTLNAGTAEAINLTPDFYAACDPDVAFDGQHIIFSGKKKQSDLWQIWQMASDGSQKQKITSAPTNCMMPVHAGNRFYLDDPQPTPQIIYTAEVAGWFDGLENGPILALFGTDPGGEITHKLTFNLFSDFGPGVLPDGRIVFSSWQPGTIGKLALLAINNDGTDLMPYFGNHETPVYKEMVSVSATDNRVYYIESDSLYWLGGGNIALLSQSRPLHSYRKLTTGQTDLYHSPCPLPDGGLIASYRLLTDPEFALYAINPENGVRGEQIYAEPGWHAIDTQVLTARPKAQGRSNWLIPGKTTGVFYCLDSYRTDLPGMDRIRDDNIKFVRVVEGLPYKEDSPLPLQEEASFSNPRRVLGTAPVENDGSFQVRVPAEIPVNFQLLDKDYIKIREQQGWTWVIGNENRGCIGCHEDRELSPPNVMIDAVRKPAVDLSGPPENRRVIDFRRQIVPIIEHSCATADCHVPGKSLPDLASEKNQAPEQADRNLYTLLTAITSPGPYVIPGTARASKLMGHISGSKMNNSNQDLSGPGINPVGTLLPEHEMRTIIEWIDLGAHWDLDQYRTENQATKE